MTTITLPRCASRRPHLLPSLRRSLALGLILGLGVGAVLKANPNKDGQPGPNVNLNEPVLVEVDGPVEVFGVVEVLNDALKTPYRMHLSGSISTALHTINFPIPEGKRLTVETVTVAMMIPPGQNAMASLQVHTPELVSHTAFLTLQSQGVFTGGDGVNRLVYRGTHSVTLRDAARVVGVFERSGTGPSFVHMSVFGYLEDI
jgi:hypothetical protein